MADSLSADQGVVATTTMPRMPRRTRRRMLTTRCQKAAPIPPTMPEGPLDRAMERSIHADSLRTTAHSRPWVLKPH